MCREKIQRLKHRYAIAAGSSFPEIFPRSCLSKLLWRASLFEEYPNIHKLAMGTATVTIQAAVRKLFASRKADVMRKATRNREPGGCVSIAERVVRRNNQKTEPSHDGAEFIAKRTKSRKNQRKKSSRR